jgi:uridine kinase
MPSTTRPSRLYCCSIDPLTQRDHSSVVVHAPADAVLIVDGVFAFRPQINEYWDLRIWLEVDPEVSSRRGIARDQDREGTEAETLHRSRYLPAERLYIAEVDPAGLAEIVIDNNAFDHPRIVRLR